MHLHRNDSLDDALGTSTAETMHLHKHDSLDDGFGTSAAEPMHLHRRDNAPLPETTASTMPFAPP